MVLQYEMFFGSIIIIFVVVASEIGQMIIENTFV